MTEDRSARVEALFHAALECEPDKREEFLQAECVGDASLKAEVESGSGNAYFDMFSEDRGYSQPILEIDYIPEPATMLLLGVGGLLIRRKK